MLRAYLDNYRKSPGTNRDSVHHAFLCPPQDLHTPSPRLLTLLQSLVPSVNPPRTLPLGKALLQGQGNSFIHKGYQASKLRE
ncbi:hypothetical protein E2C01_012055 [Portunus trituberculatus]|uniref:Uncharacterized protein n=1 Tax=Portunus trituberculatus TaxID=210409 RepID=A0A5B7DCY2_PORTR|nr:hypothetical protein [Portunus trituberculatus]